jgi:predicted glycosyltransferase
MKIWYDACTGKHVRYGATIAKHFRQLGHEVVLTTRTHPDTLALAKIINERFIPIGKYNPKSLFTRLQESSKRTIELAKLFKNNTPDIAISHQSVEMCRIAFGLNIPMILTADTPYATAVNKLTIPLANTLVVSEAIPKQIFKNYGAQKIVQFKGVDEVAWIKDFKPLESFKLKSPLIVVRQMETKASYALGKTDTTEIIARKLSSLGNVLFLTRYGKPKRKRLTVVKEFVDSASLVAHADLVVTMGGTVSREAALQGTPTIVISEFGKTYVNKYLSEKGFPLFIVDASKVLTTAKKCLGKKWNVKGRLAELENPVGIIETVTDKTLKTKGNIFSE